MRQVQIFLAVLVVALGWFIIANFGMWAMFWAFVWCWIVNLHGAVKLVRLVRGREVVVAR